MSRRANLATTGALLAVAAITAASGTAVAKPIERGTFHEEFSFVLQDFCDVDGLDIDFQGVDDGVFSLRSKGSTQLPYGSTFVVGTRTFTDPDNDRFVSEAFKVLDKELKVTDNGDGTSTILVLVTGNSTVYGMDGKAIARNPGQVRFEILIDNGGTPQDPYDDEFLEFLRDVKESTGRSDDFCAAVVPVLT